MDYSGFFRDSEDFGKPHKTLYLQGFEVVHPSGVEPDENTSKYGGNSTSGHKNGHADADLARVVSIWAKLPAALKAAILAIVNSSEVNR
jgi:hypothetical protein